MALYFVYMGPSCILQDFLFPGGKQNFWTGFVGYLFHGQWLQDLFIQDVTSFNRLITIMYPKATLFFSRKNTIKLAVGVYIAGFFIAWVANYWMPCCNFYLYYKSYSYTFLDYEDNVANYFIDTPINVVCSILAVVNYATIYSYVRISNKKVTKVMEISVQHARKSQELRYAFQFAFCTGCCVVTWISFRVMSLAMGGTNSPIFFSLTILQILHSSANSLVFLIFNKDVRQQFKHHIFGQVQIKQPMCRSVSSYTRECTRPTKSIL
uniref:7TM GPCR serpentine receptor class x (Srx) domain-containing protein n=1 Tax=Panagrolaimus sp. JU765 TaxID=591449 RepID=A0AC34RL18_9BILA